MDLRTTERPWDAPKPKRSGRWMAGAASALAAALLAGGGIAVAVEAHQGPAAGTASATQPADDSLASLTSLDGLGADVTAQPAAVVAPAANATPAPSSATAKHPARAALRRVLAVIIRQDGTAQYGQNAQKAARAAVNRFPAAFRHLPAKMQQDLWTLAGAPAGQEVSDAQNVKNNALNGTYGAAVQKLAQAIQKAPAQKAPAKTPKPSAAPSTPSPSAPATNAPSPSATTGS
ncbi:hypothetical protein [Sinomonas humi]|uniref:Uncharacterized protein n=1 Tax=Sinomonas humi TaxID=1338436 RepID=A0A0B2AIV7_9MICC|nr:hypothetical protein [Sinomonas humi]KHL03515.1 hypothetical protein LK10_08795 [Sinomonas humi]